MFFYTLLVVFLITEKSMFVEAESDPKIMVLNAVVDKLIVRLTTKMKDSGSNVVSIPDVNMDESDDFISKGLVAKSGTFGDLATIKRDGDVFIAIQENTITARLVVGIGSAQVHFGDFKAWYAAFVFADELTVYVNKNSVEVQLTLTVYEDSFKVRVDTLEMNEFGDIILERRREGVLKSVSNQFLTWIVGWFETKIKIAMEKAMRDSIEKALEKHNLL